MRKISLLLIIIIAAAVFLQCTVNSTTGLITVENKSNVKVTNIKIGSTSICWWLSPGEKYNYYFYKPITGELTADGATSGYRRIVLSGDDLEYSDEEVKEDGEYELTTNNWYSCDITEQDNDTYIRITEYEQGDNDSINNDRSDYYND